MILIEVLNFIISIQNIFWIHLMFVMIYLWIYELLKYLKQIINI